MTSSACWKCIDFPVSTPGELCDRCYASEDRKSRRLAAGTRDTLTHERTHERHRAAWSDADIEAESYRRWSAGL